MRPHCEEKEVRCDTSPTGSIAAGGLGSADACACCCPAAFSLGSGTIRDQLSLAVAIVPIRGAAADYRIHALEERLGVKASVRAYPCGCSVGSVIDLRREPCFRTSSGK